MDWCLGYADSPTCKKQHPKLHLIEKLESARNKLTPIVDNVIRYTLNSKIKDDEYNLNKNLELTPEEYHDIVWASVILQNYQFISNDLSYKLPNANIIVHNVSVDNQKGMAKKTVIVDEELILELLKLYEHMGVIINRLATETIKYQQTDKKNVAKDISDTLHGEPEPELESTDKQSAYSTSSKQASKSSMQILSPSPNSSLKFKENSKRRTSFTEELVTETESDDIDKLTPEEAAKSITSVKPDFHPAKSTSFVEAKTPELQPTKPKSSLSDLLTPPAKSEKKKPKPVATFEDEEDNEPSIFIKIKCCSRPCESGSDVGAMVINCSDRCTSNYHIKVNGEPITLKVNQNNADPNVFCINTGVECDDEQVKIIIKQCPECKGTVIGSSADIGEVWGESHESITLHGKQGDETKMVDSSESTVVPTDTKLPSKKNSPKDEPKSSSYTETDEPSQEKSVPNRPKSSLEELEDHKSFSAYNETHDEDSVRSPPKIDLLIDTENVERSTVQVHREEPLPPLTRRRLCSSMEFDVSKEPTRLRDHEIQNDNQKIVVELKTLGVDNILRACRPAKCCRKAILDEKQKTALPYCVSLRSLPLMSDDVEVIKQSINMSRNKEKNAPNLTQIHQDTFAYYISLGGQDFKPDSNIPWVVPVYEIEHTQRNDKFFVLRKPDVSQQIQSVNKLIRILNSDGKNLKSSSQSSKLYILTKTNTGCVRKKHVQLKLTKYNQTKRKKLNNISNCCMEMCHQTQTIYRKNYRNVDNKNWNLIFAEEYRHMDFSDKRSKIYRRRLSKNKSSKASVVRQTMPLKNRKMGNVTKTSANKKSLEGGDFLISLKTSAHNKYKPASKVAVYSAKMHVNTKDATVRMPLKKSKRMKLIQTKSMPSFSKNASEANHLLLAKKSRSVEWVSSRAKSPQHKKKKSRRRCSKTARRLKNSTSSQKNEEKCVKTVSSAIFLCDKRPKCVVPEKILKSDTDMEKLRTKIKPQNKETKIKTCHKTKKNKKLDKKTVESIKNQLELYIDLIDGDLVWGNTLPLKPVNYDTYYNHKNELEAPESLPPGARVPVEDPMNAVRIEPDASQRTSLLTTPVIEATPPPEEDKITISEITPAHFRLIYKNSNETIEDSQKTQSFLSLKLLGPESLDQAWVPFVTSEQSLPTLKEELAKPKMIAKVQAIPAEKDDVKPREVNEKSQKAAIDSEQEQKPKEHPKPAQETEKKSVSVKDPAEDTPQSETKTKCSTKQFCVQNKCTNCKSGACERKKPDEENVAKEKNKTKKKSDDTDRNKSKKTDQNVVYINGKAIPSCNKEICELYKNKKMIPDKKPNSSKPKANIHQRQLTVRPGDKVEIFINNGPCRSKSDKKSGKEEKPEKKEQE